MPSVRVNGTLGAAVNTDNATGLNQTTGVSIAMRERNMLNPYSNRTLFGHGASVTDGLPTLRDGYGLTTANGQLCFVVGSASAREIVGVNLPKNIASNRWTHYAVTFNNSTGEAVFYVEGLCIGRAVSATLGTTAATPATFFNMTDPHDADLFDAQIFVNKVLTPAEVLLTMQPNRIVSGCTARYFGLQFMTPGASGPIRDETGNGNTLTASSVANRCIASAEPDWRRAPLARQVMSAYSAAVTPTLVFTQQPPNTWDGEVPRQAVIVTKTTDGVTTDTGFTGTITLTKASGSGTIGGTVAVSAVAGIATLGAWTMAGSGTHTLQASDGTLTVVSSSFKVATGTGVPGGGVIILGGQMQRAMKDAETTAARKRVFFDIRDSAGAGWAGSVTGVKAKRSLSGATVADTTNDIVRVGGALHYVELDNTEAASGAAGDVIACYVPADTGRLESTHGFYEITADDVAAASNTPGEIADAVWDEALSGHSTSGTGGKVLTDAATAAGLATLSGKVDTVDDFLDTEVAAIKAKTDSLTFTVAGVLDANVQRINDVAVTGDGSSGDKFDVV